jgi:hypothetical protein
MTLAIVSNSNSNSPSTLAPPVPTHIPPSVTSFDSGYEHSFERCVDVKLLVLEADAEKDAAPATYAAAS